MSHLYKCIYPESDPKPDPNSSPDLYSPIISAKSSSAPLFVTVYSSPPVRNSHTYRAIASDAPMHRLTLTYWPHRTERQWKGSIAKKNKVNRKRAEIKIKRRRIMVCIGYRDTETNPSSIQCGIRRPVDTISVGYRTACLFALSTTKGPSFLNGYGPLLLPIDEWCGCSTYEERREANGPFFARFGRAAPLTNKNTNAKRYLFSSVGFRWVFDGIHARHGT